MRLLVNIQLQSPSQRFEDRLRGIGRLSLFQPRAIRHADAGELGNFFPSQPRDPAPLAVPGQTHILWMQPTAPGLQEFAELSGGHDPTMPAVR